MKIIQWRTQKIFIGGFHSVAYSGYLYLLCTVCDVTIWRRIHVSNQRSGEVWWHNMHILQHALSLFYVLLHWI